MQKDPAQERVESVARELARKLKRSVPEDVGFVILVAAHGDDGYTGFISTIERETACELMRECLARMDLPEGE